MRAISTQAIRAVLLANATAAAFGFFHSRSPWIQAPAGVSLARHAQHGRCAHDEQPPQVAIAHLADAGLPLLAATAVGAGRQTQPGANCRPERNRLGSGALAAMALAVIGPMPEIVVSRRLVSSARCQLRMRRSSASISAPSASS